MKAFESFKLSVILFPIVLASAAQAHDLGQAGKEVNQWVADPGDFQPPFSDRGKFSDQGAVGSDPDPVKSFRPFTAPGPNEQYGGWPNPAPQRPVRAKAARTSSAVDSFRPFSEPTEPTATAADQPPPGSTLSTDGHKDKFFNPQLSAHSNTTNRSTSGYVLTKTGKYALRYGPRILQFIRY